MICPSILRLLFIRRPPAIFGRIWTIVVNSIQRFSIWAISHVFVELFKGLNPTITNSYSSSSVSVIVFASWIKTSIFDSIPRLVRLCFAFSMRGSVCISTMDFFPVAAATRCISSIKAIQWYFAKFPARTFAQTPRSSVFLESGNNNQAPILLVYDINHIQCGY